MATREQKIKARRMAHDFVWRTCDLLSGLTPESIRGDSELANEYRLELDRIAEKHAKLGQLMKGR